MRGILFVASKLGVSFGEDESLSGQRYVWKRIRSIQPVAKCYLSRSTATEKLGGIIDV